MHRVCSDREDVVAKLVSLRMAERKPLRGGSRQSLGEHWNIGRPSRLPTEVGEK